MSSVKRQQTKTGKKKKNNTKEKCMLEVNICTFVVLVELSDFDAEVLVEGPVSSGIMEGKYCIEIRLFFG